MKSSSSVMSALESAGEKYLAALAGYSEEQFARKPDAESWSMGQLYHHLVEGTRRYHLQHIEKCIAGTGPVQGGKTLVGTLTYLLGGFPPVRIKVPPSGDYTPKQPENITHMRIRLEGLIAVMRETERRVAAASRVHKTQHPAFGYLNAREWFALVEMHFRHHLRQKRRLDEFLHD